MIRWSWLLDTKIGTEDWLIPGKVSSVSGSNIIYLASITTSTAFTSNSLNFVGTITVWLDCNPNPNIGGDYIIVFHTKYGHYEINLRDPTEDKIKKLIEDELRSESRVWVPAKTPSLIIEAIKLGMERVANE